MRTLLVILLIIPIYCIGQRVNDTPIDSIDAKYIELVGTRALIKYNKVNIQVDFGQGDKLFNAKDAHFLDENDKPIHFNSMIDALNYFDKFGYDYVNSYAVTHGNSNVYHILMRRRE